MTEFTPTFGVAKRDTGPSVGGFFTNLFEDARDTATGIPLGLWMLGTSVANDAARGMSGGAFGDEFMLDDVAKGMGSYYWNDSPIGAILQGDLGEAASRTYDKPFSSALDAFSVASLGAGAAAKVGVIPKVAGTTEKLAAPGLSGLEASYKLSRNPLAAQAQKTLLTRKGEKALADPSGKAAKAVTRRAFMQAFGKSRRASDALASQYLRLSDEIVAAHGTNGELASAVKASGMTVDDVIEGYGRTLRGEQKTWFDAASSAAAKRADLYGDYDKGIHETARSAIQRRIDDARKKAAVPKVEGKRLGAKAAFQSELDDLFTPAALRNVSLPMGARSLVDDAPKLVDNTDELRLLMDEYDKLGPDELAGDVHARHMDNAADAAERAKVYDLSPEAAAALQQRVNTLSANRDQIAQLVDSPELNAWYEHARTLSDDTADLYRANNPRFYEKAVDGEDAALAENRTMLEQRRTHEWNVLHPDRDVPEYVRERAIYRPHKDVDDHATPVRGIKKSNETPKSSLHNTGTRFLGGLDDPNPRHLAEAYLEQRESGLHNQIRADLASHAEPMTRAEYARRVAGGEELVTLTNDPKLIAQLQTDAKLIRKIAGTVEEGTAGAIKPLADELDDAIRFFEEGGRFKDRKVIAVPKNVYDSLRQEPRYAQTALSKTLSKSTDYWRHAVLSYRAPQWMLNNAVGQAILLAVGAGPARGGRELMRLLKDAELSRAVDDVGSEISSTAPGVQLTETHAGMRGSSLKERWTKNLPEGKLAKAGTRYLRVGERIGEFNAKWADDPFRKSRFLSYARKDIDALKAAGKATDDADAVRQLAENTDWLDDAIQTTLDDMIDFGSLKPFEKAYLRNIFPFYSWMKGSAKVTARHLRDKPTQAQQATALSDTALDQQEERYGALPSFMQGAIPVPEMFQNDAGTRMVSTAGMNPFMSPVDTASALGQFAPFVGLPETYGGESLIAQMNPFLKAPIAAATGKDPFYGGNLSGKPMIPFLPFTMDNRGEYMINQLTGIPQTKLVGDLTSDPVPTSMYDREAWHSLLQFFGGLPVKDMRLGQAHARALQEQSNDGAVNKG